MNKPNESKQIKTVNHNGRTIVVGCVGSGAPLERSSSSKP